MNDAAPENAPENTPKWLVYGLPCSSLGVRLLLDERDARRYAQSGFKVTAIEELTFHPDRLECGCDGSCICYTRR